MKHTLALALLALCLSLAACDSDGSAPGPDVVAGPDLLAGPDATSLCEEGAWRCSEDLALLESCAGGSWTTTDCAASHTLCEEGACVPPWRFGAPVWGTCPDVEGATAESLAEKAAYYDDISARLHVHPGLKWMAPVTLPQDGSVDEATATYEDVVAFRHGENDGLWSAMYMASQAFRYGTTGSEEALAMIRVLLEGEVDRMNVTGVPGVFTREMIPPGGIPGVECPTDDAAYVTDVEKDDNQWVQIREDGCAWVIPHETMVWTKTAHCGLEAYAGWCFLDNVSQDEYAGHMLALGALMALVDVPDVQATVRDLLGKVGRHLMENDLTFVDWDGRTTEHGLIYPAAFVNSPGYLSIQSMNWLLLAVEATGDPELRAYYDECLMQRGPEPVACFDYFMMGTTPFIDWLDQMLLYFDGQGPSAEGCGSNWNNFSMMLANFHTLLIYEREPTARAAIHAALDEQVMRPAHRIPLIDQKNPWYNFVWAAMKPLGPGTEGPAYQAVEDGICSLRQFPASQRGVARDNVAAYPHYCDDRLDKSMTDVLIPVHERCSATFLFWRNPYLRTICADAPNLINPPADYLLAYWIGRYYGFIGENL